MEIFLSAAGDTVFFTVCAKGDMDKRIAADNNNLVFINNTFLIGVKVSKSVAA